MKKLSILLLALSLSVAAFGQSKNYEFKQLKSNMEKNGYKLEYVKKDQGFNFTKGKSHVEVTECKDYATLNSHVATAINVLEEKGYRLVSNECDFGNGLLVFSNDKVPNYGFVMAINYKKLIILNTGGNQKELEFAFKTLKDAFKK